MPRVHRSTRRLTAIAAVIALAATAAALVSAAGPAAARSTAAHKCLVMTGSGDGSFTKNFNPYTGTGLPSGQFINGAMYEPLLVVGEGGLKPVPWLARSWKWTNHNKTLTLKIAKGVKWSDGKPLTANDVVYSLKAGKQDPIMDRVGLTGAANEIKSISGSVKKSSVKIVLKAADSQFIAATLNRQFVVPQHIWSKVADVATFTNAKPVSSGPYNRITRFTTQDYVFSKNTKYWQKKGVNAPKVSCLEYVQAASNDAALALIQSGQVDWTHNFVPNVESAYVAKDKKHFHSFYATTAYPVSLKFDDTVYPYSLSVFRKALSLAINRKSVSKLGEYGYAPPTDAIGLNGLFPSWVVDKSVKAKAKAMSAYKPAAAKTMLKGAGFTYNSGNLIDPHGHAVQLDIHVISGWSDWVASNNIITSNLRDIGIDSHVVLEPDWGAWQPNAYATNNPTLLWENGSQGSPYGFFYANLSKNAFIPSGQDGERTGNWEHYADAKATKLLTQWKATLVPKTQQQLATKLENIWLNDMPEVPIFIGPRWSTYSTKFFHNFDTKKNFWGDPIFTTFPDNILSFVRITPGGKAGA